VKKTTKKLATTRKHIEDGIPEKVETGQSDRKHPKTWKKSWRKFAPRRFRNW
jgi:hypothetical protein